MKMASATLMSRILGLLRELILAATFGATGLTDSFVLAFRIPTLLRDLLAEGTFSSAFVPLFIEINKKKGRNAARRLLGSMVILTGGVTLFISGIIIWKAGSIVQLFVSDLFIEDLEHWKITKTLVQMTVPFIFLISLSALFLGALNSLKFFFIPALAPSLSNIAMIFSMLLLPPILENYDLPAIYALAIGTLCGGILQVSLQFFLICKHRYAPLFSFSLYNKYTSQIAQRLGIGTIGIAATQINFFVGTLLASGTQIGALSCLSYAFRFFQFPVGILAVSLSNTTLVHFAEAWKKEDFERAKKLLHGSYCFFIAMIMPIFALLYVLAFESIHIVFERGAFNAHNTLMTAKALELYLLGLPFYGLYKIFAPIFFVLDQPHIPVYISLCSILFNIIFSITLVPVFGFQILALGTSVAIFINCFLQILFLKKKLNLDLHFFISWKICKFLLGGLVTWGVVEYLIQKFPIEEELFFYKICILTAISLCGLISYIGTLILTGETLSWKKLLIFKR